MNWLDRIDNLFSTRNRRFAMLHLFVGLYWLWQLVWIVLLLVDLSSVSDYEGLLLLQSSLSRYEGCWLTRIFIGLVQSGGMNPWALLFTVTHMQNVVFLFLSLLECIRSRKNRLWAVCLVLFMAGLAAAVWSGFSSGSLYEVIVLLRLTGSFGLVFAAVLLLSLLADLVRLVIGAYTDEF